MRNWSPPGEEELRSVVAEGSNVTEIARHLGRPEDWKEIEETLT